LKNYKQWENQQQYFELTQNPNTMPTQQQATSNPVARGASSPVAPSASLNSSGVANPQDNDPTYMALVQGLNGNLETFVSKLIKALNGKNPQILMAVQAAVNNAVNGTLGEKGASFANRANRTTIVNARQNLQN
jgi:hypothetical protein